MKKLMLTTAILLASTGLVAAQTAADPAGDPAADVATTAPAVNSVPGFRVSEFTGMSLYTLNPDALTELRAAQPAGTAADERSSRWTSGETFIAGRDQWEDIGKINDVILSQDGHIQGVLLDIGGFLGIGSRTVMVGTNDLYFVADTTTPAELGDFFVVASMSRDQLEALPEWTDANLIVGYALQDEVTVADEVAVDTVDTTGATTAEPVADQSAAVAPTADELTGAEVQDLAGETIGSVNDLVLSGDTVSGAIVDVGGFLGLGAKSVIVPVDTLAVIRDADNSVLRIETSLTREQLEALPEHTAG